MSTNRLPDIAFIGKMGSGKTTAAEGLAIAEGYRRISFAHPLKEIASQIWGPDAMKDREKLQGLGVAVREIDPDAWVNLLLQRVNGIRHQVDAHSWASVPVVVDDCRFPNEYWALKEAGFLIIRVHAAQSRRVDRLKAIGKLQSEEQLYHQSETALDGWDVDYEVPNDGTPEEFGAAVRDILVREEARV